MDTIKVHVLGTLDPAIRESLDQSKDYESGEWKVSGSIRTTSFGMPKHRFTAVRKRPHIHISGIDGRLEKALFHLPEVLHGYNGIQIKSQAELDAALERARELIAEITCTRVSFGIFTRVDFAYNLPCHPPALLASLNNLRHPSIRKNTVRYQNNAVQWTGGAYTLSVYPKNHRRADKKGFPHDRHFETEDNHLRIEVQAKTKAAVKKLFGTDGVAPHKTLQFHTIWAGYRKFLSKMPVGATTNAGPCDLLPLLSLCNQQGVRLPCGKSVLDWWKEGKQPETIRKVLREINGISFTGESFNLTDLIPVDPPTRFLDVLPDGSTREVIVSPEPQPGTI